MRIGFLAMSGIRVRDEELMALGLTLPGFVERSKVVASLPSLGLLYLAAVTPPGHELCYFEAEGATERNRRRCTGATSWRSARFPPRCGRPTPSPGASGRGGSP